MKKDKSPKKKLNTMRYIKRMSKPMAALLLAISLIMSTPLTDRGAYAANALPLEAPGTEDSLAADTLTPELSTQAPATEDSTGTELSAMTEDSTGTELPATTEDSTGVGLPALSALAAERDIMALVYLGDEIEAYTSPSLDSEITATLTSGQTVYIQDASYNKEEDILWIYASFAGASGELSGYFDRRMLACSDERFLNWEKTNFADNALQGMENKLYAADGRSVSADIAQFPESYQASLTTLKNLHPQWVFVPMETGLDWNTVISQELKGGRSLVHKSFPDYTKAGAYDDGNWFYATREILEYYMDPRNGLTEDRIFQFELLTYNETYHTEKAVERFLQNTFMRSPDPAPGTEMTYAHIFWAVGAEEGREVSPFHLAARVYQEQGQGTSGLISGKYPGYEGYYNYFNVGASGTTTAQVITNGLKYAKEHNWNNAYFSILGGADVISANYIKKGQDTLYLQKYNVNPKASHALYTHQYMQNISAPTTEGASIKKLYAQADSLNNSFVFKIPVYKNMPANASPYPSGSSGIALQIPSGYDITVWIDGVPYLPETQNGQQFVKYTDSNATNAVVYKYEDSVPTSMYVWTLTYQDGKYTATPQSKLEGLLSYDGFSIRISGDSGIRMKAGIDASLKSTLVKSGVGGYKLKEYGILMTEQSSTSSNESMDSFVKGGEGVLAAMSYGKDARGQQLDIIFETVDGRDRFTSVLVGLSADSYKKVYYFRSYAVLSKGGKDSIVYGPIVSRSMVSLAEQVCGSNDYAKDSDAYLYLQKIIEDAK
ncbi:MAG: hypothetical protein NC092_02140 [Butyrivibrio sp.]|nr:hypothetical protein [Muribaculum sp.]MCM1551474.1 hypothetical protein [Butyrivibrio sp.]